MKKYKKILIVTHQYLPHVSPRTTRWKLLVEELISKGHEVTILTGMYPDFDKNNVKILKIIIFKVMINQIFKALNISVIYDELTKKIRH